MINKTLLEYVTDWLCRQRDKHGLDYDYPERTVNAMSNYELLTEISQYLEAVYGDPE